MGNTFGLTLWPTLYDKDSHTTCLETWDEVCRRFGAHIRLQRKDQSSGFGPYILSPPPRPCNRHQDGVTRQTPHRCDSCVPGLTLAVFDADTGTLEQIRACAQRLEADALAHLWYTTFSHTEYKPSYRLVIPLATPVLPDAWASFRTEMIRLYGIPCDPKKCGGKSHFYYLPSCPEGAEPRTYVAPGRFLEPEKIVVNRARPVVRFANLDDFTWEPPASTGPVDTAAIRKTLAQKISRLNRKGERGKAAALRACVDGEPLAEKGSRNETTFKVAGMLAWLLPGEPLSTFLWLMGPSVGAMQRAGSSVTLEATERMLLTAMRNKAEADYLSKKSLENIRKQLDEFRAGLFKSAGLVTHGGKAESGSVEVLQPSSEAGGEQRTEEG